MNEILFTTECGALFNINTLDLFQMEDASDRTSWVASFEQRGVLFRVSAFFSLAFFLTLTTYSYAPTVPVDDQIPVPVAEHQPTMDEQLNQWGYQKLINNIGMDKTREVAELIESSFYPDLIRSIIMVESNWDPDARSNVDALGLMQVRMIAAGEVDPEITEELLFDPVTNVQIGIYIFEEHMKHFVEREATEHWALTSYNRGRGGTFALHIIPPSTDYSRKVLDLLDLIG